MKTFKYLSIAVLLFFVCLSPANAVTKPSADADLSGFSYIFYLYYDAGQLIGDRDYQVKFDVVNEKFVAPSPSTGGYKVEIYDYKSKLVQTVQFDPKQGNPTFTRGKVTVKAPYISDAIRASFYDNQNHQLMTIFLSAASLCNDDGFCSATNGENEKSCPNDCKKAGTTPLASSVPPPSTDGPDYMMLLIYAVAGIGVAVAAWFGWRWWKNKNEGNFTPPPSSAPQPPPLTPPTPEL